MNMWSVLPDELWSTIMEIGIETKSLDHKAICRLSTACRRFRRLTGDDSVWSLLVLHSDFPYFGNDLDLSEINCDSSSSSSSDNISKFKSLFKIRYKKERVLAEHGRKIQEIMLQTSQEVQRINERMAEFRDAVMSGNEESFFEHYASANQNSG